jgi:hypothetical protein
VNRAVLTDRSVGPCDLSGSCTEIVHSTYFTRPCHSALVNAGSRCGCNPDQASSPDPQYVVYLLDVFRPKLALAHQSPDTPNPEPHHADRLSVRLVLAGIHVHCFNHLVKTIRARYGPSVRNWFLVLSMSQFHIPFYAGRTLPNFMILPGGTAGLILYPNRGQAESHVMLIHRSPPQLLLVATLLLKFRSTAGHSLAAASLHLPPHLPRYQCPARTRRIRDPPRAHLGPPTEGQPRGGVFLWGVRGIRRSSCVPPYVLLCCQPLYGALTCGCILAVIAGPIDHELWSRALPHASLPQFTSWWQFAWPELASLQYNLFQGQASNWGIMPAHYYFTNSLPKLLMSALPLAVFGLVWAAADKLGMLGNGNSNGNGGKGFGKAVWEIWCLFGPALAGLLGAMSAVGHKVGAATIPDSRWKADSPRNGGSSSTWCPYSISLQRSPLLRCTFSTLTLAMECSQHPRWETRATWHDHDQSPGNGIPHLPQHAQLPRRLRLVHPRGGRSRTTAPE